MTVSDSQWPERARTHSHQADLVLHLDNVGARLFDIALVVTSRADSSGAHRGTDLARRAEVVGWADDDDG